MRILHLARRAVGSISNAPPRNSSAAAELLNEGELAMWNSMPGRDRRHSLQVLARFDRFEPSATGDERAAALLHDVGKTVSGLGWVGRVVATVVGARGRRFSEYHDHEAIGAAMIEGVSSTRTVALVGGSARDKVAESLRRADDL